MAKKGNNFEQYQASIFRFTSSGMDISRRTICAKDGEATLLFIKQLTDRAMLTELVIRPMMQYLSNMREMPDPETSMNRILQIDDCRMESDEGLMLSHILNGLTVMLFSAEEHYLVLDLKKVEKKSVEKPTLSFPQRGPADALNENLDTNLSLIRYRIKDPSIRIEQMQIGRRTGTKVALIYLKDIANDQIVNDILSRIKAIDVDAILDSGELQNMILDKENNIFPQLGISERSDKACGALLEGKVVILVEGSKLALIAPKTFSEFIESGDDMYDNKIFGFAVRILRYVAVFLSISLSAFFIAVTSFNHDVLPSEYVIFIASIRSNVPFNALTSVIILVIITEILREALFRVPQQIGTAIGIVGTIIIGQAAISAGFFSPILLITVSVEFLASFVVPDYTIMNVLRVLKVLVILLTGMFGFYGFTAAMYVVLVMMVSSNSFSVPFMAPLAPFNWYDFSRSFIYSKRLAPKRPGFLKTKNKKRI